MLSLFSFSDNWMDLAKRYPEEFIKEVERRYLLDRDWRLFIKATKEGHRADKSFPKKDVQLNQVSGLSGLIRITE